MQKYEPPFPMVIRLSHMRGGVSETFCHSRWRGTKGKTNTKATHASGRLSESISNELEMGGRVSESISQSVIEVRGVNIVFLEFSIGGGE